MELVFFFITVVLIFAHDKNVTDHQYEMNERLKRIESNFKDKGCPGEPDVTVKFGK